MRTAELSALAADAPLCLREYGTLAVVTVVHARTSVSEVRVNRVRRGSNRKVGEVAEVSNRDLALVTPRDLEQIEAANAAGVEADSIAAALKGAGILLAPIRYVSTPAVRVGNRRQYGEETGHREVTLTLSDDEFGRLVSILATHRTATCSKCGTQQPVFPVGGSLFVSVHESPSIAGTSCDGSALSTGLAANGGAS